jgi:putative membrane protein
MFAKTTRAAFALAITLSLALIASTADAQLRRERNRQRDPSRPNQYQNQTSDQTQQGRDQYSDRSSDTAARSNTRQSGNQGQTGAEVDYFLANCLQIKNNGEIEMNRFAMGRAENADVKQFAEQMVEDHQQLAQQLSQVSNKQAGGNNAVLNRVLEIERDIAKHCGQQAQDKLQQKTGAEFDECFLGAQIVAHMQMLSSLDVISQQATGELQTVAKEARSTVASHLQHAEQLAEQLKSEHTQASRPSNQQR